MPNRFSFPLFISALLSSLFIPFTNAQSGCPDCQISLPPLPQDTIYTDSIPPGQYGVTYLEDISFRMPKTTTPVHAVDPGVPPGITLDNIEITSVTGLPAGIDWELSESLFNPQLATDGCVRFCGTPLQSGLFIIQINIEAQLFVLKEKSEVILPLLIEPAVSNTDGFTMTNGEGCGTVEVSFQNNIPSNGQSGFSYFWDFDNGYSTTDENPYNQIYSEPGNYIVNYEALIDTIGYLLNSVTLTQSPCTDLFSQPDHYIHIRNGDGLIVYTTPDQTNASVPLTFSFGDLPIAEGQYTMEVWDEDGGVDGSDDLCGIIPFTQTTTGTIDIGNLAASFDIAHPTSTVTATDTVIVFPLPDPPLLGFLEGSSPNCPGEIIVLGSSYSDGNQWYQDSLLLPGQTNQSYATAQAGSYYLLYTDENGCEAYSDTLEIVTDAAPTQPYFYNYDNWLVMDSTLVLPEEFALLWYLNGLPLEGGTEPEWCAMESGVYMLVLTDLETGCTNSFDQDIPFNPDGNCVTGTHELFAGIQIYPNPTERYLFIEGTQLSDFPQKLILFNAQGRQAGFWESTSGVGPACIRIDLESFPGGMYHLFMQGAGKSRGARILKR